MELDAVDVRIVDHFIRERLRERVTVDVPASGKVERTFAFKAGDSKDYRIHIELREGRTGDSLMRHLLTDVTIGMRPTIVLSGDWEMLLPGNDALTFPPEGNWERVQIPMRNYGGWRAKNHRAWFRKRFAIPKAFAGRHIIVRFEAVAHHAVVYVNGKRIGEHLGGFEPFEFDITHVAKVGAENELLVGVTDWLAGLVDGVKPPDDPEKLPNHCMLTPYGTRPHARRGIWDDVFLFVRDAVYIADVFVMPSVREGALAIAMALRNETDGNVRITVTNEVWDGDKRVLTFPKRTVRLRANDATEIRLVRVWRNPHLWFPFDPHLYRLRTRIEVNGRTVDEINTRFGFREFWIDGINYRLNGRIFKLRGLGCPPIGAGRDEIRKYFVERLSANFTLVRFHMMPRAKHYYEIADEVGMCVKDES
ncbi:MAG TPA: hypothetical protein EYP10_08505, partial [Armatimonadetes bacterium]|nr:hypothetical protein [Armatimonadota bacterium]